jgi:acetyl-CoA carboxylase biotin carboxyl carrier protein
VHGALSLVASLGADDALSAPTVGTWRAAVGRGAPLEPGMILGYLHRAGRSVAVTAPARTGGVAVDVTASGAWIAFGETLVQSGEGAGVAVARPGRSARPSDIPDDATIIEAETDGTIYLRSDPTAPAFVSEGDTIAVRATVALVEVMKTFTPVRATVAGTVVRVCVDDGAAVEAGDALFWLRPSA